MAERPAQLVRLRFGQATAIVHARAGAPGGDAPEASRAGRPATAPKALFATRAMHGGGPHRPQRLAPARAAPYYLLCWQRDHFDDRRPSMSASIRGHFLWHELMTTDTAAAGPFYRKVVGWKPVAWDQDPSYTMWMAGKTPMGGLMRIPDEAAAAKASPSWMAYIGTDDIDATVRDVERLGGKVLRAAWEIPSVGKIAILQDPQGAVFAAYSPATAPTPTYPVAVGDFSWHELATTDPDAAFKFYQELFGWQPAGSHDMGPDGVYQMFGLDGHAFGGIYRKPAGMAAPPHWLVYAKVRDSKKAAAAAQAAGGTVVNGPMEVPGGDWIAQIVDPQGAAFGVHSVAPASGAKAEQPAPAASEPAAASELAAAPEAAATPPKRRAPARRAAARKRAAAAKRPSKKRAVKGARAAAARKAKQAPRAAKARKPAARKAAVRKAAARKAARKATPKAGGRGKAMKRTAPRRATARRRATRGRQRGR
jgi:predicted enzyme related to lactoylglutathione lyase